MSSVLLEKDQINGVRALTVSPRRASLFKIQRTVRAKELVCTGGGPPQGGRILFTSNRSVGSKTIKVRSS